MSNRLTFSLASLIVIFALAFAATPVMAQNAVPVRITEYAGPNTVNDTTANAEQHVQARDDFRVVIAFDHAVSGFVAADVEYRLFNTNTGAFVPSTTDVSTITQLTNTNSYVAVIPGITDILHTAIEVSVAAGAARGTTPPDHGDNAAAVEEFTLPILLVGTGILSAEASFGMPQPVPGQPAQYMVDVVFTNTSPTTGGPYTEESDNTPPVVDAKQLTSDYIDIVPAGHADITLISARRDSAAPDPADTAGVAGTSTYTLTVTLRDAEPHTAVTLSIDPGYAMTAEMAGTVRVPTPLAQPAAPTVTPTATTTSITLTWTAATGATYEYRQGTSGDWADVTSPKMVSGLTANTEYTFQVRVKESGRAPAGMIATITHSTDAVSIPTVAGEVTVPAGGYVAVVRDMDLNHLSDDTLPVGSWVVTPDSINIQEWSGMPDLATHFRRSAPGKGGGALTLTKSSNHTANNGNIGVGTVGISEIMWGWDEGSVFGQTLNQLHTQEQWIEVHNTNNFEVKVVLKAYNATDHTVQALNAQAGELDRMSNFNVNNVWDVKGNSGNSAIGKDFVSMRRVKNGNPYTHGDNNGKNGGKWHASEFVYLRKVSSQSASPLLEKLVYEFKGTPGRPNTIPVTGAPSRTNVARSPIIFNEVANLRDQTLEWIELKNVSDSARDLRNYEISLITGVGTETRLFHFAYGDNHVIMQPGEVLLLVDTDPRYNDGHPIAVGYNVRGGNDQALGLGDNAPRYLVTNFAEGGLPDNGEFVLVLRTSKPDENYENKKGTRDRISDAVGWHPNLASTGHPLYTHLWPFAVFGAPHVHNKIALETVHYRQHVIDPDKWTHGNRNPEHLALRDAGYTGVGYKRFASRHNPAHGGTPGYDHNGLIKQLTPDIGGGGVVTISEIMFDQGDGRYPQWIELYNSSDSPVNLRAGDHGWRLVIENYDDGEIPINRLSGTLNFRNSDVQTILPKQTVIVASTRARNSGSAFFDTSVIFPPTRVYSVWDDSRGSLDMKRTTDPILSTEGFYIELIDGKNNVSDSVGNLIDSPNRRVAAEIAWPLSDITGEMMEDAPRSSIIRRYREPKGGDSRSWVPYTAAQILDMGIKAEGWVLASTTDFREVRQTWFGHQTDIGSPGITGGRILPVELSTFRPVRLDDGSVAVRWITESEKDNAGFNILRSDDRNGEFTKLNTQLIAGQGTTSERTAYEFVDKTAKPNVVYYYQIQDVSLDGDIEVLKITHLRGHVSPSGKAATTWGDLKTLQ